MKRLTIEEPETKTTDILSENIAQLKELFPEVFTEGRFDFEVLRQLLGETVDEREEKYGLNWHGKRRARQLALTPSSGTLRPCPEESEYWDTTKNLMIEGDNLEVLKLLQKSYAGKVKLIYIDPPYNTGKDFVYPDDYQDNIKNYLDITGQTDEFGNKITSNTETSGRFHTDWLNMMYPRLKIARNLLKEDGVIIVSIDDGELANIRHLLDEIYGEECRIATIIWHNSSRNSDLIAVEHEYLIVYAKQPSANGAKWNRSREIAKELQGIVEKSRKEGKSILETEDILSQQINLYLEEDNHRGTRNYSWLINYKNIDQEWQIYYPVDLSGEGSGPARRFGDKIVPAPPGRHWMGQEYLDELIAENRIVWRGDRAYRKLFIYESLENLKSIIQIPTRNGSELLKKILGKDVFDKPKPHNLIQHLLYFITEAKKNDIVMDFFAGSGTTGHAVILQNTIDDGNRRYIMVQLPEPLDPEIYEQKNAVAFCDKIKKPRNLAEITKERLRRVGENLREQTPHFHGDFGFRVFKLDSTNIRTWDPDLTNLPQSLLDSVEHIKLGRTEEDILFELLLKLGLDLTVPIERQKIAGKTVHSVGGGVLLICLDPNISNNDVEPLALGIAEWHREQAPAGESTVVFRDSGFADDKAKADLSAMLEQHGLEKVRSL